MEKKIKKFLSKTLSVLTVPALACAAFAGCAGQDRSSSMTASELLTRKSTQQGSFAAVAQETAVSGLLDFSLEFMNEALSLAEDENPVLSPASAYFALTLLACGSDGVTSQELSDVLNIPEGEWADYGNTLQKWLNRSEDDTMLQSADSVWFDSDGGYEARQEYLNAVSSALDASVYRSDLQSEAAVNDINKWVNDATNGLIKKLHEEPYNDLVKAVLLNALYFEAKWNNPFTAEATGEKTFTASDGSEVQTDFLRDYECYRYYILSDNAEGILMPYTDGDMAFLALRPTDGSPPEELLASLSADDLKQMTDIENMQTTYMNFSMPKFDINYSQELNDTFSAIGLEQSMLEAGADLSYMFENEEASEMTLDAMQVVRIQVDEEGTKAAAVTEIATSEAAAIIEDQPLELHLDSPFLYAIVDTQTAIPLFMGILENPR